MAQRVLLIDDDVELLELMRDYLAREGFAVQLAHDGASGAAAARGGAFDIAVLDVMMPGQSGIETLRQIRASSDLPVLMLTARGDDADRILGLELGADDYVPKPCTPRELTARLRAILKRTGTAGAGGAAGSIEAGRLRLRPAERRAEFGGQALKLTSTEYNILEILARNAGRPVSKEELSQEALGRPLARYDCSIDVHVSSIRQKLARLGDGAALIQTVIRKGYQLVVLPEA